MIPATIVDVTKRKDGTFAVTADLKTGGRVHFSTSEVPSPGCINPEDLRVRDTGMSSRRCFRDMDNPNPFGGVSFFGCEW